MIKRYHSFLVLPFLMLAGCATPNANPEFAREVVLKHVSEGIGTVGPFKRKDLKELGELSAADRNSAVALLEHGALGFLICSPEDAAAPAANGAAADLIKVDRIVFVEGGKIVGDFPAAK